MTKITDADFEKVRKYVAIMSQPPGGIDYYNQLAVRQQVYEAARPAAVFLIEYYFKFIKPDNGERSRMGAGPRPYNSTVAERAVVALKNDFPFFGHYGDVFLEQYPDLLEEAIAHYKAKQKERLSQALIESLSTMTGEQLLLILQEYDRRKIEGYPLETPSENPDQKSSVYRNPYEIMAEVSKVQQADPGSQATPSE